MGCAGDTFRRWNCFAIATDTTCHIINSTSLLPQKTYIGRGVLHLNSVLPTGFCEILSPVFIQLLPEMCKSRKNFKHFKKKLIASATYQDYCNIKIFILSAHTKRLYKLLI